jgi:hypothetical protein
MRNSMGWDVIDPRYQAVAREVIDALDGDRSTVSVGELDRRIRVKLLDAGIRDVVAPQRMPVREPNWQ